MSEYRSSGMTPEEAREALAVAEQATVATPEDRRLLERGLIGIGVTMGVLILALRLTIGNPAAPNWLRQGGFAVIMALYLVAIVAAVVTMRRAKAAPRGFTSRYTVGIAGSFLVYTAYIVFQAGAIDTGLSWMWTVLGAIAAMTPALLAARSISKLPLR